MLQLIKLSTIAIMLAIGGCSDRLSGPGPSAQHAAPPTTAAATPEFSYSGLLRSGVDADKAPGPEHTGWEIESGASPSGWLEVDVSAVLEQAKQLDGKQVTITGAIIQRHSLLYPKRQVLLARAIVAIP